MSTKRVEGWTEDGKTAVEVPTHRSQQRLKAIAKPGHGWDEDVHTVAGPVGAILPAEAFREDQAVPPVPPPPSAEGTPPPLPPPTAARVAVAPVASALAAPLSPAAPAPVADPLVNEPALAAPAPRARAKLRPGQWVLVCLTAAVFGALGYAAVMSWSGLL